MPDFDNMNETDVREVVVRPFLHRLGYSHGTEANIRTEQTFRYEKAFLGRKNPKKDPPLVGRADYILDVTAYGKWVVEVKSPAETINRETVEQAHTYAAHPEVAAIFFLVSNGREFHLYRTSSLASPLMVWTWSEIDEVFLAVLNLVGPDAIKRKMKFLEPDTGKPLARGVASDVKIIGGHIKYLDHVSNHPLLDMEMINGLELPVTGGRVYRLGDGRIWAQVNIAKSAPMMRALSEIVEREDGYDFSTSDEFISIDRENPTILQNFYETNMLAGTLMSFPGLGKIPNPLGFRMTAITDAIGFVEGDTFMGTMQLSYEFFFSAMPSIIRATLEGRFGRIPDIPAAQGGGTFEVKLLNF